MNLNRRPYRHGLQITNVQIPRNAPQKTARFVVSGIAGGSDDDPVESRGHILPITRLPNHGQSDRGEHVRHDGVCAAVHDAVDVAVGLINA